MSDIRYYWEKNAEISGAISRDVAEAVELYVLEEGPLRLEHHDGKTFITVKQHVRLRLKEAAELRAEGALAERQRIVEAVKALCDGWGNDPEVARLIEATILAAIN